MLELFTCELPYKELTTLQALSTNHPPEVLSKIKDEDVFSLIADCLRPLKAGRATLNQCYDKLKKIEENNNENLGKPVDMFADDYRYDVN